jgi:molybdate transport system ATP-binding protein
MGDGIGGSTLSDEARLEVEIRHRIGGMALDVAFRLTAPWTVLFAPSGAGKSTVLRVIAGLVQPDYGRIVSTTYPGTKSEIRVVLTDTEAGVAVPPHKRWIRHMAQEAALFPHMTVAENVGYEFRDKRYPKVWRGHIEDVMTVCQVEHLAEKMPSTISGGEGQRVALARAIQPVTKLALLLDEPFSGLDSVLRDELMQRMKARMFAEQVPVLHVTHDVGEAFALDAEVIRMEGGRVVAQGSASVVLAGERERLMRQLGKPAGLTVRSRE